MKKSELDIWYRYNKAYKNGEYFEREDTREMLRLNHLVIEQANKIHNDNMLGVIKTI